MYEIHTLKFKRSIAKTVLLSTAISCCVAPFGANNKQLTVAATVQEEKAEIYSHIYEKYKIGNGDSLYFIGYCCRKCTEFI